MQIMEARLARVSKWGNSLAVRLPAALAEDLSLKDGDQVTLTLDGKGGLTLAHDRRREAAVAAIGRQGWRLPPDYKFNREEANSRKGDD